MHACALQQSRPSELPFSLGPTFSQWRKVRQAIQETSRTALHPRSITPINSFHSFIELTSVIKQSVSAAWFERKVGLVLAMVDAHAEATGRPYALVLRGRADHVIVAPLDLRRLGAEFARRPSVSAPNARAHAHRCAANATRRMGAITTAHDRSRHSPLTTSPPLSTQHYSQLTTAAAAAAAAVAAAAAAAQVVAARGHFLALAERSDLITSDHFAIGTPEAMREYVRTPPTVTTVELGIPRAERPRSSLLVPDLFVDSANCTCARA